MKNRIQKKSNQAKLFILAGLFTVASAFTASAQNAYAVFLKKEKSRDYYSDENGIKTDTTESKNYIIWNIENDTYRTIFVDDERGEYSMGGEREWRVNKSIFNRATGRTYSILSKYDRTQEINGDVFSDYIKGPKSLKSIEDGNTPRRASIAKLYRGWGHHQWNVDHDRKARNWRVIEFHMQYLDTYTRRVNNKKFDKLEDAQLFIAEILESEGGWRERQ